MGEKNALKASLDSRNGLKCRENKMRSEEITVVDVGST